MSVRTITYAPTLSADTNRGPSEAIWSTCPVADLQQDPRLGMYFFDDFTVAGNAATTGAIGNIGQWASWVDTNAILGVDPQQDGGVLFFNDNSHTTLNVTMGSTAGSFRMVTAATGNAVLNPGKLWFECRCAVGSITTGKRDAFVGLVDNTTNFSTASATAVINTANVLQTVPALFGFHFRDTTNPTDVGLAFNAAGGTVQYPTNLQTLSLTVAGAALTAFTAGATGALATGFVKLGFLYDPNAYFQQISSASSGQTAGAVKRTLIKIYVNGQPAPAFLTTDNLVTTTFPATWLAPVMSYTSRAASGSGGLYVDWIRVAQLANS